MNQRIKELIEQAEIKFESHPQHQGIDTAVIIPTDLEKFAQLIVRECLEQIDDGNSDHAGGNREAIDRIKEHFGVKE